MSNLMILTNYYPFYKGEEYLESEIKYLSDKFDKILLFPTLISGDMSITREVPSNVTVVPVTYNNTLKDKLISLISSFKLDKQSKNRIKEDAKFNPVHIMYDSYFEVRTKHSYIQIADYLKKNEVFDGREWIIYSYWMHATAKIASDLKRVYFNNNVKYTLTRAHRYDVDINASPIGFLPERKYILQTMDNVYCVSTNNKKYLQETFPEHAAKIKVEHLGTKQTSKNATAKNRPFKIVSCSLMRKVKNVDKIVQALSELDDNVKESIEWTHFGNGPEFEKIKKLASENLTQIKVNLPGYVSNSDVINWYKENEPTLFINVSSSEGIPVSIMESMSFGIPCIATNVGGNSEIVRDGHNGFLVPESISSLDLSKLITKAQQLSTEEFNTISNNAFEIWREEFWAHHNYSKFSEMLINKYYN